MDDDRLPLAPAHREDAARRLFAEYREMSPHEWVARFAHRIGTSSFDGYRYREAALTRWIRTLHRVLRDPVEIERQRRRYLSPQEYARVKADERTF